MKKNLIGIVALVIAAVVAIFLLHSPTPENSVDDGRSSSSRAQRKIPGESHKNRMVKDAWSPIADASILSAANRTAASDSDDEENKKEEEERLVNTFDELTDHWMEPSKAAVTIADVDKFVSQLAKVPKSRREECLQRALNLIPDENVMLLVGVLMDKSQPREMTELVFNDILNRDEGVKKPILQQVFKDKSHPCWADTAWILDVTGEMPTKK